MLCPFEIDTDIENRIIRLSVRGFWTRAEALSYRDLLKDSIDSLQGQNWNILADVVMFPVQIPFVQSIHQELMQYAISRGLIKAANIIGNAITRIQIQRLASSTGSSKGRFAYFLTEREALEWLKDSVNDYTEVEIDKHFQTV